MGTNTLEKPLQIERMYSTVESYHCPDAACDTAIPDTHRLSEISRNGGTRDVTILCPTCGRVHMAVFVLVMGTWRPAHPAPIELKGVDARNRMRRLVDINERARVVAQQDQSR